MPWKLMVALLFFIYSPHSVSLAAKYDHRHNPTNIICKKDWAGQMVCWDKGEKVAYDYGCTVTFFGVYMCRQKPVSWCKFDDKAWQCWPMRQ